ncbi:MAG: DUF3237 domain-containing protein [Gemmobacter sp.]
MIAMLPLATRPLLILSVDLAPAQALGGTPQGDRKIVPVLGGTVEGRVTGRVLPGGGDWALTRADGVLTLDVRLTVEAADGGLIHVTYTGMRHGPAAVMARLAAGERVDPSEMYFRIAPRFETAAPAHAWLNRILAVGVGERLPAGPRYHVHEVL